MKTPRFIVVCPRGLATGGPEALHQLCHSLRLNGADSVMWDPDPLRRKSDAVSTYDNYENVWISEDPDKGDILIVPEVYSELIPKFYNTNQIIFWWLSVDNFFETKYLPIELLRDFFPKVSHAYQSEYASKFLTQMLIRETIPLSDYLNEEYLNQLVQDSVFEKNRYSQPKLAINPAKGLERTKLVLDRLPEESVVRLEHMSHVEIAKALDGATCYLDLGHHPGKDRFPREAAARGCIVLTNKRGSASNKIDIPIDSDEFKFDDFGSDYVDKIISKLEELNSNSKHFSEMQSGYRKVIQFQKNVFDSEVAALVAKFGLGFPELNENESIQTDCLSSYLSGLFSERDGAIAERDGAIAERDGAIAERDGAIAERDGAIAERDGAIAERDGAIAERYGAIAERDGAIAERDGAIAERDGAIQDFAVAQNQILDLEKSLSWRFTRPLRYLDKLLRRLF